jgi:beta-xylosidase
MSRLGAALLLLVGGCGGQLSDGDGSLEEGLAWQNADEQTFIAQITDDTRDEDAAFDGGDSGFDAIPIRANAVRLGGATYTNPLLSHIEDRFECPDPSVVDTHQRAYRYVMVCTSGPSPNGFFIRKSNDLQRWHNVGFVFPSGHWPSWGKPNFWAPEIYRLEGRWLVVFAAELTDSEADRFHVAHGTMVVGAATARHLRGPWSPYILHRAHEFHPSQENFGHGGAIDPSLVRAADGQLYLFWAVQMTEIWAGQLSERSNGELALSSDIHKLLCTGLYCGSQDPAHAPQDWERDPLNGDSTAEGPEPFLASDGHVYLLYSGANTWDGTYAVGVARSVTENPLDGLDKKLPDARILRSGGRALGPGHSSHPVIGPNGDEYLLYHAQIDVTGHSRARKLMLDRFDWPGAWPRVHDGRPSLSPQLLP